MEQFQLDMICKIYQAKKYNPDNAIQAFAIESFNSLCDVIRLSQFIDREEVSENIQNTIKPLVLELKRNVLQLESLILKEEENDLAHPYEATTKRMEATEASNEAMRVKAKKL